MSAEFEEILIDTGAPRDQGSRPTCISFAISDVHRSAISLLELLSPEALHRAAAIRGNHPVNEAVTDNAALAALTHDGQTIEACWPYHSPSCLDPLAIFHKRSGQREGFNPNSISTLLKSGIPSVLILDIGAEFFFCDGASELQMMHIEPVEACHAVVITGTRLKEGDRHFRLKNSWGSDWADGGYVWASASYILCRSPFIVRVA
jgi:hypothetical protein